MAVLLDKERGKLDHNKKINGYWMELNFKPGTPYKYDRELLENGIREPGATEIFQDVLMRLKSNHKNIHVFDIGANIGYYSLMEAQILNEANIYAIEIGSENIKKLKRNIELNEYDHIEIMPFAAGAERTTKEFLNSSSNVHTMSDVFPERSDTNKTEIDVYPIEHVVSEKKHFKRCINNCKDGC